VLHNKARVAFVASPVLGRPDVAADGALQILAGGDPAHLAKLAPVFEVLGKRIWSMGNEPSGAHATKIACNMMITMAIEAITACLLSNQPMEGAKFSRQACGGSPRCSRIHLASSLGVR